MSGGKGPLPPELWNKTPLKKFYALVRANNKYHMPKEEQLKVVLLFAVPTVLIMSGFERFCSLEEWWNKPVEPKKPTCN